MRVTRLDHLVLTVRDIEQSVAFYQKLGMKRQTFADNRTALQFGDQKINLHQLGREYYPNAAKAQSGSADLCFITCGSLKDTMAHLSAMGIDIEEGPVARTGATGPIDSVYIRDPDGNLIELAEYRVD
ncbi:MULTISPECIES: VOC family protein [Shewanella]|uniref:VOC family protein n=1 Tax=Shewanella indica TaxID=768528 RepID=A0ABU4QHD8_9GAMM|nr:MULTISPECIES: VOC family protein [Shewanella]MDX6018261.1 VOC family protein [Shewanella indica]OIN14944.1 hypothetical protein BFS86_10285 [Shewanella algae]QWL04708.1 VOC family protein [Shewanella indica]